jgi:glycosyltransferase involved in cell wall biosynthesis
MYYPVFNGHDKNRSGRFTLLLHGDKKQEAELVETYRRIVEDFRPDIIQVFGSEHSFGLVASQTKVPVILHVQGLMGPCFKSYLPPGSSWRQYILSPFRPGLVLYKIYSREKWRRAVERERRILSGIRYYLGRTWWDRQQVSQIRPDAVFFEGGELMRRPFYETVADPANLPAELTLVSTISEAPYKGFDLILRTGKILREEYRLDFKWTVFGNVEPRYFEIFTGISVAEAGITLGGVASAEQLAAEISHASLYVHPSYVENSPNSVCEAQLLGVPVVATSVGGVSSLIDDGRTGFLVRSGSAEEIAERIVAMYRNRELLRSVGRNARAEALKRHDREKIASSLLEVYRQLV